MGLVGSLGALNEPQDELCPIVGTEVLGIHDEHPFFSTLGHVNGFHGEPRGEPRGEPTGHQGVNGAEMWMALTSRGGAPQ